MLGCDFRQTKTNAEKCRVEYWKKIVEMRYASYLFKYRYLSKAVQKFGFSIASSTAFVWKERYEK